MRGSSGNSHDEVRCGVPDEDLDHASTALQDAVRGAVALESTEEREAAKHALRNEHGNPEGVEVGWKAQGHADGRAFRQFNGVGWIRAVR